MPIKLTQSHHALSLQNGYHLQNNYAAAMTNGSTTYLHQQNRLTVLQLQLKNAFTNGQQDMAIAVNGSRPVSYIGHVVGNGTLTTIFVGRGSTEPKLLLSHNRSLCICMLILQLPKSHHLAVARHRLRHIRYISNRWWVVLVRRIS